MIEAQLRDTLLAYHPAVVGLFSSVDRDATLAFLRDYPTPRAASHIGEERMARFCSWIGYSGRVPPGVLVERVRTNLLSASDGSVAGHRYAALHLADQLELFNNQLRAYNRRIGELLVQHPDSAIFLSFDPVSRTRYLASMERGTTYHGALRAVSSSWLRVLWRCWQDGTTYDPARHRPNS